MTRRTLLQDRSGERLPPVNIRGNSHCCARNLSRGSCIFSGQARPCSRRCLPAHGGCLGFFPHITASIPIDPAGKFDLWSRCPIPSRKGGWLRSSLLFGGRRQDPLQSKENAHRCRTLSTFPVLLALHKGLLETSPYSSGPDGVQMLPVAVQLDTCPFIFSLHSRD